MPHAIMRKCAMLLLAIFGFTVISLAQTVTGTVTDKKGEPLPGVTVTVKGTKNATSTSTQGVYTLKNVGADAVLVFTGAGITVQELPVSGKSSVNAELEANVGSLSEVVVQVGYGGVRKKDVTGAVSTIRAKDFNQGVITNPDQLFQGKIAGLQVINNSGQPGAATTVRIRGYSSVRSGTGQPLYVIDGVPLDGRTARPGFNANGLGTTPDVNPLLFINPNDIATMDVLKDASATAIYGSRGANGVILINTKKGTGGNPKVDLSYMIGASKAARKYKVATPNEYRGLLETYNLTAKDSLANVDAQDAILRTALSQNVAVGMSGGNENSNYRLSLAYLNNEGIIKNSGLKKYLASIKGQMKFLASKKLSLDYYMTYGQVEEDIVPVTNNAGFTGSLMSGALGWNPTLSLNNADGSIRQLGSTALVNPIALLAGYKDRAVMRNFFAYASPSYKFTNELELKTTIGINSQTATRKAQMKKFLTVAGVEGRGVGFNADNELNTLLVNSVLSYNKKINANFTLNALVGYEYQKFGFKGTSIAGQDFLTDEIDFTKVLQNASQASISTGSFEDPSSELQSYFGRAVVNYADRYIVTATMRADGSNKFGSNNKYGYFPSFAGKWNISNESFAKSTSSSKLQNVGLRLGWGITGSQEFPAGSAQDQYRFIQGGIVQSNYGNKNLKWEKTTQLNIGLDFTLLKRIQVSADYFDKNTSQIIFNRQLPLPGPATRYWVNLPGNIINKGVELKIDAAIVAKKDITWNVGVNATFLSNKLTNYDGGEVLTGTISGPGLSGANAQKLDNNISLFSFYLPIYQGLDANGFSTFLQADGKTVGTGSDAKFFVGNALPKTTVGISTDVTYKKVSLSATLWGAFGQKVFNNTALAALHISKLGVYNVDPRYISAGENANNAIAPSTRYLEKGDFLKLANLTLRYNFGDVDFLKGLSVYVSAQNLFWITKYKGVDPEVNTDKQNNGVASQGMEYTPYPSARTFQFGFNVSF